MFGIGSLELVICGFIMLVFFGNRLPSVAKALGESVKNFKKGISDDNG
jgi:TatA/E family protein of Tat protein translocase